MNCRAADHLIQQSLDVPLSPSERARLDAHLAACPACLRAWDEYRTLSQMAGAWVRRPGSSETMPQEFTAQVMARVMATPSTAPRPLWPLLAAVLFGAGLLAALSPVVWPLLPAVAGWHAAWSAPTLEGLRLWWAALPADLSGLWTSAGGWISMPLAALLILIALPANALLCLRARGGARRTA